MNKNYFKIGGICLLIGIGLSTLFWKWYWPETELEKIDEKVEDTVIHKDLSKIDINKPEDCETLKKYVESPIRVKTEVKGNKLFGTAYDDIKSADFMVEFRTRDMRKHIFQLGLGWLYRTGYYVRPGYLYNFDLFAIGGSVILPVTNYDNWAVEVMIQKRF